MAGPRSSLLLFCLKRASLGCTFLITNVKSSNSNEYDLAAVPDLTTNSSSCLEMWISALTLGIQSREVSSSSMGRATEKLKAKMIFLAPRLLCYLLEKVTHWLLANRSLTALRLA